MFGGGGAAKSESWGHWLQKKSYYYRKVSTHWNMEFNISNKLELAHRWLVQIHKTRNFEEFWNKILGYWFDKFLALISWGNSVWWFFCIFGPEELDSSLSLVMNDHLWLLIHYQTQPECRYVCRQYSVSEAISQLTGKKPSQREWLLSVSQYRNPWWLVVKPVNLTFVDGMK